MRVFISALAIAGSLSTLVGCSSTGGHYGSNDQEINAYLRNGGLPVAHPEEQKKAQTAHRSESGNDHGRSASYQHSEE